LGIELNPLTLEGIRERIREMTDLELCQDGQSAKAMADPTRNFDQPNPVFEIQLREARLEWRRRHPKLPSTESE
jgi:hypothetical protein